MTLPAWRIESPSAERATSASPTRSVCCTASSGIAKRAPPASTTSPCSAAMETGTWTSTRTPRPGSLRMLISPLSWDRVERTTSKPMPLPDNSVTSLEVVSPTTPALPSSAMTCSADRAFAAAAGTIPRATATFRTASTSIPRPSSVSTKATRLPRRRTSKRSCPAGGLASAIRSASDSTPWATALRTTCISASRSEASTFASRRTSPPDASNATRLPSVWAASRTDRASDANTV